MKPLLLYENYNREEVHELFSPHTRFTPQSGTWGLQGIVSIPNSDDFVFFVTIGAKQADHTFNEGITNDGILLWDSQPKHKFKSKTIQKLIHHNDQINTIYLFMRTTSRNPQYVYLGRLAYLSHDPIQEKPVRFCWQLLDWPVPENIKTEFNIGASFITPVTPITQVGIDKRVQLASYKPPTTSAFHSRHVDFVKQNIINSNVGDIGEDIILEIEKQRLIQSGLNDLAEMVYLTRERIGNNAPYDIHSFETDGSDRYVEVKSTVSDLYTDFFISARELAFYQTHSCQYVLYRVYHLDVTTQNADYVIINDFHRFCDLTATNYRAKFSLAFFE